MTIVERPGLAALRTTGPDLGVDLYGIDDIDAAMDAIDPVTYEVLRNRVSQINEEQGTTMMHVSGSPIAAFAGDFNMVIADEAGNVVTVGPYVQWHGVILDAMIKRVLDLRAKSPGLRPGDIYICNDPYEGAGHMNDVAVMAPLFVEGRLFAWTASMLHHADVGGINGGSFCVDAREPAQEPTPFPYVRMVEEGVLREDLEALWRRHSRLPETASLDLRAQIAGNNVAHSRLQDLLDRYGPELVHAILKRMLRDAERLVRERLREFPDGTWRSIEIVDKDREGDTHLYKVQLNLTKQGDELTFNTRGTDPQTGILSCTFGAFRAAMLTPLLPYLCFDIPWATGGIMRAVKFETEPGTLVDAEFPALTSCATSSGVFSAMDVAQTCVNRMLSTHPTLRREIVAEHYSNWAFTMMSGTNQYGDPMVALLMDPMASGVGARSYKDGVDSGGSVCCPRAKTPMVEINESLYPMLYLYRREAVDGGGAGRYRGGTGVEFAYALHDTPSEMGHLMFSHGVTLPVTNGIGGGYPGTAIEYVMNREAAHRERFAAGEMPTDILDVPGTIEYPDFKGNDRQGVDDLYATVVTGSGGYGDPLEREAEVVAGDVQDGYVSQGAAAALYGVVTDPEGVLDEGATIATRERIRAERLACPLGEGSAEAPAAAADAPRRPYSEALSIAPTEGDGDADGRGVAVVTCSRCGHALCDAADNYKDYARQKRMPVAELPRGIDPARYGMTETAELRQYFCPECAVLIESEVAIVGDPLLREIELDLQRLRTP